MAGSKIGRRTEVDMPRKLSEERTRKEMIDPQLENAGWYLRDHSKVKTEIPVDGYDAEAETQVNRSFYSLLVESFDA